MKLQDALRRSVRQFGISVLKDKRLVFVLSDYRAFDEYPAVREVMAAIYEEGFGPELFSQALDSEDDDTAYLNFVRTLKDTLVSRRHFRREFVNYAIDSITLAIGLRDSVTEPGDSGFDAGKKDPHGPEGAPDQDDPAYIFAMGERYFYPKTRFIVTRYSTSAYCCCCYFNRQERCTLSAVSERVYPVPYIRSSRFSA